MASSVTPLAEDEGMEVDGAVEVEGAAVYVHDRLGQSWASLRLMVALFMAPMTKKWGDAGKETEIWWRIHVIAEEKISISRVIVSL